MFPSPEPPFAPTPIQNLDPLADFTSSCSSTMNHYQDARMAMHFLATPHHSPILTDKSFNESEDDTFSTEKWECISVASHSDPLQEPLEHAGHSTDSPSFIAGKKAFIKTLTLPCAERGMLMCKLCHTKIWGPNGRYHIEVCPVLTPHRARQDRDDIILYSINGIRIYHQFFEKPKPLKAKMAKIPGFVMSNTVLLDNPYMAPTRAQLKAGFEVGRKGYTRCLSCNQEIHAPNTRRHISLCANNFHFNGK